MLGMYERNIPTMSSCMPAVLLQHISASSREKTGICRNSLPMDHQQGGSVPSNSQTWICSQVVIH